MAKVAPLVIGNFSVGMDTNIDSSLKNPNALKYIINMNHDPSHTKLGTLKSRRGFENRFGYIDGDVSAVDPDDYIVGLGIQQDPTLLAAVKQRGAGVYTYQYPENGGKISSFADAGGGQVTVTLVSNHNLGNGEVVRIEETTNYNGEYVISNASLNVFDITATFVSNDATGEWYSGEWENTMLATPYNWGDSSIVRYETIDEDVYGTSTGGAIKFYELGSDWATTNLTGVSNAYGLIKLFQGKLYIKSSKHTLRFSDPITVGSTVIWTTTNTITLYPKTDGDNITAFENNGSLLLIWKQATMYTYDGVSTQSEPLYKVGCTSQDTVQTIRGITFWAWDKSKNVGIYVYTGGEPEEIGWPVKEFLSHANLTSFKKNRAENFGSWSDDDNYFLSIGDVTIENVVYPNVILQYSLDNKSWTAHSVAKASGSTDNFFKFGIFWNSAASTTTEIFLPIFDQTSVAGAHERKVVIAGTCLGLTTNDAVGISPVVWDWKDSGGDDVGESTNNPISILVQTDKLAWGYFSRLKQVNKFSIYADGNLGQVVVQMRIDGGKWVPLGGLTDKKTLFEPGAQGYYFEFRVIGDITGEQFIFERFDFFDVTIEDDET